MQSKIPVYPYNAKTAQERGEIEASKKNIAAYTEKLKAAKTEEERQQTEGGGRKYYLGLPITASALAFPLFYLLGLLLPGGPYILAAGVLLLAALYVTPLHIPKPGLSAICLLSAVGALELAGLILAALGRL